MSKFGDALKKVDAERRGKKEPAPAAQLPASPLLRSPSPAVLPAQGERREFKRIRCFAMGHVVINFAGGDALIGPCTILNFSNKGLLLDMEHPPEDNKRSKPATAEVRIAPSQDSPDAIIVTGRVVRSIVLGKIQVAVQFSEPMRGFTDNFQKLLAG